MPSSATPSVEGDNVEGPEAESAARSNPASKAIAELITTFKRRGIFHRPEAYAIILMMLGLLGAGAYTFVQARGIALDDTGRKAAPSSATSSSMA
jgi:hypothetical protein